MLAFWRPAFWIAAEVVSTTRYLVVVLRVLLLLFIQGPTMRVRYTRRPWPLPVPCALTPPGSHALEEDTRPEPPTPHSQARAATCAEARTQP